MTPAPDPATGVAGIELVRVRLPLRTPFRTAHGTELARDVVLVRAMGADGVEGWGECSALDEPTYTGEYTDGAWHVLRRFVVPEVLAGRPATVRGHPMARAAVAHALADLALRRADRSLAEDLGATRGEVPSCAVVGIQPSLDELVLAVADAVELGHHQVKLKVRPGWCAEPLSVVRAAWPGLALAADANGSFGLGDAGALDPLDQLGLVYLEQPFGPDELVATAALAARWATPVALDESLGSVGQAEAALALGVAGLPGCTLPTDLGPSERYFAKDVTAPFSLRGGALAVPGGPGIGVVPDPAVVDELAVARLVVWP